MSATIELNYDHSKGTARAFMSGSTVVVQASAYSGCYIGSIYQSCNRGNNRETSYGSGTRTVTFYSYGHTDCVYISVTVNFFGEPDGGGGGGGGAGTRVLTVYPVVAEGEGTVSPPVQTVSVYQCQMAHFTLVASPAPGFTFVEWRLNDNGGDNYSTTHRISTKATLDQWQSVCYNWTMYYFAVFAPIKFSFCHGFDISAVPEPNNVGFDRSGWYRRSAIRNNIGASGDVQLCAVNSTELEFNFMYNGYCNIYGKDGQLVASSGDAVSRPFARVNTSPPGTEGADTQFAHGDTITSTFSVIDAGVWGALGFQFLGWRVTYNNPATGESGTVEDLVVTTSQGGGSAVSFVADKVSVADLTDSGGSSPAIYIYTIVALIGGADLFRLELLCSPPYSAKLAVLNVATTANVNGMIVAWARAGTVVTLQVISILREFGFIHGWSRSLADASGGVASKSYPVPAEDSRVTVYICTHKLLYKPNQNKLLYGPGLKLLYDCSVPPGTRVYP